MLCRGIPDSSRESFSRLKRQLPGRKKETAWRKETPPWLGLITQKQEPDGRLRLPLSRLQGPQDNPATRGKPGAVPVTAFAHQHTRPPLPWALSPKGSQRQPGRGRAAHQLLSSLTATPLPSASECMGFNDAMNYKPKWPSSAASLNREYIILLP